MSLPRKTVLRRVMDNISYRGSRFSRGKSSRGGGGRGHPPGLKGKEIGMYYAQKQREKYAQKKDMIDITDEQKAEIKRITHMLRTSAIDKNVFGEVDYESEFMRAYQENLHVNASSTNESLFPVDNSAENGCDLSQVNVEKASFFQRSTKMNAFREKLPAFKLRQEIIDLVRKHNICVISGETGCGKTTQVPQYLLEDGLSSGQRPRIVCTQPRRISAITVSERVADELGETVGSSVGYQIRLENVLPKSRQGWILFCTTGIVLQWMVGNPQLSRITHLIIDEIHERDLQSDFILTLLKDLSCQRPDLKIILMSATLNARAFSKYFFNCPTICIPGFTFPVKEYYLEDVLEMTRFDLLRELAKEPIKEPKVWHQYSKKGKRERQEKSDYEKMIGPYIRNELMGNYSSKTIDTLWNSNCEKLNPNLVAALVHHIHVKEDDAGAILVFLPGWDDISKVNTALTSERSPFFLHFAKIYPLHSLMPTASQREIFQRPPANMRKVVLATNIAETSITIDDVVFVVDCGKIKMTKFDTAANLSTFQAEWVSLANARQRRGRAGRVQPGVCYHLYSKAREMALESYLLPEIQRKRLDEVILQVKLLGMGKIKQFLQKVMDPPTQEAVELSLDLLQSLNAIGEKEQLTPLGYHLAHLPMDPQTGKMILLGAIFSCLDPVLSVAASLSFKDAFVIPLGKEEMVDKIRRKLAGNSRSDHLLMANVMLQWEHHSRNGTTRSFCQENFLSDNTLKMLHNHKQQFAQHLFNMSFVRSSNTKDPDSNRNSDNEALVRAVICAGLYPNVAMVKKVVKGQAVMLRTHQEGSVELHPKSVNSKVDHFKYQWLVFHLKMKSGKVHLYDSSMVSPLSLVLFGQLLNHGIENINGIDIHLVKIDKMIKFNCDEGTYIIVKRLKETLNQFLAFKVANPGCTNWDPDSSEGALLTAIAKLLAMEVKVVCAETIENNM